MQTVLRGLAVPRFYRAAVHPLILAILVLSVVLGSFAYPQPALADGAPIPSVSLGLMDTGQPFIGQSFHFRVTFDNTGQDADPLTSDVGYGPYVDLYLPRGGADGSADEIPNDQDDGIFFQTATYLGVPLQQTVFNFSLAQPTIEHPYAKDVLGQPVVITGQPGDQLVVLELPFGSFTYHQTPVDIDVQALVSPLADLLTPLTVRAQAGFRYGLDPLDNPTRDPSFVGAEQTLDVTPTLLRLDKRYIGPEDETATGPNFPRRYTITASLAYLQTLTDLALTDLLPGSLQYLSADLPAVLPGDVTPLTGVPGGELTRITSIFSSGNAIGQRTMQLDFYVPELDAFSQPVLQPDTGAPRPSINNARATASWMPLDPRDSLTSVVSDVTPNDHSLTDRSLAIQKGHELVIDGGAEGPTPGDTILYTLYFQVSDYFAFQNVRVDADVLGDGLEFDSTFTPRLTLSRDGSSQDLLFDASHYSLTPPATTGDGTTRLQFLISDQLEASGSSGQLLGGLVQDNLNLNENDGATQGQIQYRAKIRDAYLDEDSYPGDLIINQGDRVENHVTILGDLLEKATCTDGTCDPYAPIVTVSDTSGDTLVVPVGNLTKDVYALNGVTTGLANPVIITANDRLTYEFEYNLSLGDFESLTFTDFLPLPIFHATDPEGDGGAPQLIWEQESNGAAVVPSVGKWMYGPNDTLHTLFPTVIPAVSANATANALVFDYQNNIQDLDNQTAKVHLLFTVSASTDPFADGLFLTNQVTQRDQNTIGAPQMANSIIQIKLSEPNLSLTKGVIATDRPSQVTFTPTVPAWFNASGCPRLLGTLTSLNLAATPLTSDLSGLEAGDQVTFAVVVENKGSGTNGAFDVKVADTLPAGMEFVPGSLCVTDGTGSAFTTSGDLFAEGITLADGASGSLAAYSEDSGLNLALITYQAQLTSQAPVGVNLENTAELISFAAAEGAENFLDVPLEDAAQVETLRPSLSKSLLSSSNPYTLNFNAAIGEVLTYRTVITLPQGETPNLTLTDALTGDLAFIGCDSITPSDSSHLSSSLGDLTTLCSAASFSANGKTMTLGLGTVSNTDLDRATAETITLQYRVVVLDLPANERGDFQRNNAKIEWTQAGSTASATAPVVTATTVEPSLEVLKVASDNSGDAGNVIHFTVTVRHRTSGSISNADALDVILTDVVPTGMTVIENSLTQSGETPDAGLTETSTRIEAGWSRLPLGHSATLEFDVTLDAAISPGTSMTNRANLSWSSMPGEVDDPQTTLGPDASHSIERTSTTYDDEIVTVPTAAIAKSILSTSLATTTGENELVIGETATYRVRVTVPQGVSEVTSLSDTLPAGLAIVSCNASRVSSGALTSSLVADWSDLCGAAAVTAGAHSFTLPLGTLTNAAAPGSGNEWFEIDYTVVALNLASNQSPNVLNNQANWKWTRDNVVRTVSSVKGVRLMEPALVVDKTTTSPSGDAGDTITFNLVVSHKGAPNASETNAYDVILNDIVPSGMTLVPGSARFVSGLTATTPLQEVGSQVSIGWDNFPTGSTAAIRFDVTLDSDVKPGQVIENTASVQWSSLPGAGGPVIPSVPESGERTGTTDALDPNDYLHSEGAMVTVTLPVPTKTIVASSEAHTIGTARAAIGEVLRYRLVVQIPEGQAPNFQLVDDLPNGLRFLNDGLAKVAFVATDFNPHGVFSARVNNTLPGCESLEATAAVASVTPSCPLPDAVVSRSGSDDLNEGQYNDSAIVYFNLGNLENRDRDADGEYLVLEFNALVDNILANQSGVSLTNGFTVKIGGSQVGTSTTAAVSLVEPVISTLTKTVSALTADAGDPLTYTLSFANIASGANASTAFDVVVTDTLPSFVELLNVQVQAPANSVPDISASVLGVGGTAKVKLALLDPRASYGTAVSSVTVTLQTRVIPQAPATQSFDNKAQVGYSGLPGAGNGASMTLPALLGSGGAANGERNDRKDLTANDYQVDSGTVNTQITAPNLKKFNLTPKAAPGQIATFELLVTLPEGNTQGLLINDMLPSGLEVVDAAIVPDAARLTLPYSNPESLAAAILTPTAGSGGGVSFALGTVTTADDNLAGNNSFVLRVRARVLNLLTQNRDATLVNRAQLSYTNPNNSQTVSLPEVNATLQVIEPTLQTTKSVSPTSGVEAGDLLTYTVRFTNVDADASAYAVSALDTPSAYLVFLNNITCKDQSNASVPVVVHNLGASLQFGRDEEGWTISPLGWIECTYGMTALTSLPADGTYSNQIDADWASQPVGTSEARLYQDLETYPADGILDQDDAAFSVDAPSITKDHGDLSEASIGGVMTYTLSVQAPLGTLRSLVVTDNLPTGVRFLNDVDVTGVASAPSLTRSGPTDGSGSESLTWTFADALVTASPVQISFPVQVVNLPANQAGDLLQNNASLSYLDGAGVSHSLPAEDTFPLVEPNLTLDKRISGEPATVEAGERVEYELEITANIENASVAYDLHLVDALPPQLALDLTSITVIPEIATPGWNLSTAGQLELLLGELNPEARLTVRYAAILQDNLEPDASITNTAQLAYSSQPGSVANERDYTTQDSATLTANGGISLEKALEATSLAATQAAEVTIGEVLTYSLTVSLPQGSIPLMELVDDLPAGLAFVPGSLQVDPGEVTMPLPAPQLITGTVGSGSEIYMAFTNLVVPGDNNPNNNSFTVRFQALVLDDPALSGLPAQSNLENTAQARLGTKAPVSALPVAVTVVEPRLTLSKAFEPTGALVGDWVTVTLTMENTGLSPAYEPLLIDPLALTDFDLVEEGQTPSGFTFKLQTQPGGFEVRYEPEAGWSLAVGQSRSFQFRARVGANVALMSTLTNTAEILHYHTLPGAPATARTEPPVSAQAALDVGAADLMLTKTDGPDPVVAGEILTYTLLVSNAGPNPVSGVVLTDTLPAEVVFQQIEGTGWNCTRNGQVLSCTLPELDRQASTQATLTVMVNSDLLGTIINTAEVARPGVDPDPTNNESQAETEVLGLADVSVTKSDQADPILASQGLTYTLNVHNAGPSDARSLVLTETLPAELIFGGITGEGWLCEDAPLVAVLTCTRELLAAGQSAPLTLTGTLAVDFAGSLTNTVEVQASTPDPDVSNNEDEETTQVIPLPLLSVEKTVALLEDVAQDDSANPGETLAYTITVRNYGSLAAANVTITDTLDANLSLVSGSVEVTPAGDILLGNGSGDSSVEVYLATLPPGQQASVSFQVRVVWPLVNPTQEIRNQAWVSGGNIPTQPSNDPTTPEDDDPTIVPLTWPIVQAKKQAEMAVDSDSSGTVSRGDTLRYTFDVRNEGTGPAVNLTLSDLLNEHTALVVGSVQTNQGLIVTGNNEGDQSVEVRVTRLEVGVPLTITFLAVIDPNLPKEVTQIENQAIVSGGNVEPMDTDDPTAPGITDPTITPLVWPELHADKSAFLSQDEDESGAISPGDVLTYRIEVRNEGTGPAVGVVVSDTLDVNTRLIAGSVQTSQGTVRLGNAVGDDRVQVEVGTLTAQAVVTLTFQARVNADVPTEVRQLENQALVSSRNHLPTPTNDPDTPTPADPTVVQIMTPTAVTLLYFQAESLEGGAVRLTWATAAEIDHFGYRLYRTQSNAFVTPELLAELPGGVPDADGVRRYEWTDQTFEGETWWYWLEDVGLDGRRTLHPLSVTPRARLYSTRLFLPFVRR